MLRSLRVSLLMVFVAQMLVGCAAPVAEPTLAPVPVSSPTSLPPTPAEPTAIADDLTYEQAVQLFDYSPSTPEVKELSVEDGDGYAVHEILYTTHDPKIGIVKGWVTASLVRPDGEGAFAGILFLHQYGPSESNRKEFLKEAKTLAGQGVISLLIDGYFPWNTFPSDAEGDRKNIIGQVIELRRALDFLIAQPGVDAQRIAFVGHNFGASYGGILSGVDERVKFYVLMTGWGKLSDVLLTPYFIAKEDPEAYRKTLSVVEPVFYIPHTTQAQLLFQFANNDQYITKTQATEFSSAAGGPTEVRWYETINQLDEVAQQERLDWLALQLELPVVP